MHILSRYCTNVAEWNLFSVLCSRALVSAPRAQPAPNARSFEMRCKRSDAIHASGKCRCCLPPPKSSTPVNFWMQKLVTIATPFIRCERTSFWNGAKVTDHLTRKNKFRQRFWHFFNRLSTSNYTQARLICILDFYISK